MEAVRRALAAPLRYARPLARRLARNVELAARVVKKLAARKLWPSEAEPTPAAPSGSLDPEQME
jgi:hypothetical protein